MELNYFQQLIVTGIMKHRRAAVNKFFAGGAALSTGGAAGVGLPRWAWQRRRLAAYDAQAGLVPMRLTVLLGHVPTTGERVRFHREYARLEAMGLLERHYLTGGRRATHLRLTNAGQLVAENLQAENDAVPDENGTADIATDGTPADGFPLLQLLGWQADCPADADAGTIAAEETEACREAVVAPPSPPDTTLASPGPPWTPLPAPTTTCPAAQP